MIVPVVIRGEFGGFSLTAEVVERLEKRGCKWLRRMGKAGDRWYLPADNDVLRRDPDFVAVVREMERLTVCSRILIRMV